MAYNNAKGYDGEIECAEFLQSLYSDDIVVRFGGVEFNKFHHSGDVGILQVRKKLNRIDRAKRLVENSPLYHVFIEVKKQAAPNIWKDYQKAKDDADNAGKKFVLLYTIKQKRGEKGIRLICLDPATFSYLMKSGT